MTSHVVACLVDTAWGLANVDILSSLLPWAPPTPQMLLESSRIQSPALCWPLAITMNEHGPCPQAAFSPLQRRICANTYSIIQAILTCGLELGMHSVTLLFSPIGGQLLEGV